MFVAIILLLVAVGTVAFHFWSPWWFTELASNWGSMDTTIIITFWVTGTVFIAVVLFMAYCVYRFRYQPDRRAEYEPENKKLEVWLSALTAVGVAILLAPGLIIWNNYVTVPDDATDIEVVGSQWQWAYRYPGADGVLGTSDVRNINDDNPFGLHADDPNGKDDILVDSDDLHLPVGQSVNVLLRSIDVLHDFYVPQFRAKMDMVPGLVTFFWLTPTRTGTFDILCAELCGSGHYAMRGKVVVEEPAAFNAWLAEQQTFAQQQAKVREKAKEGSSLALNAAGAEPVKSVVAR
jgi:cytochrome c oxidase subunit 2